MYNLVLVYINYAEDFTSLAVGESNRDMPNNPLKQYKISHRFRMLYKRRQEYSLGCLRLSVDVKGRNWIKYANGFTSCSLG